MFVVCVSIPFSIASPNYTLTTFPDTGSGQTENGHAQQVTGTDLKRRHTPSTVGTCAPDSTDLGGVPCPPTEVDHTSTTSERPDMLSEHCMVIVMCDNSTVRVWCTIAVLVLSLPALASFSGFIEEGGMMLSVIILFKV